MGFGNWHVTTQSSGAKVKPVAYEPCDSYPPCRGIYSLRESQEVNHLGTVMIPWVLLSFFLLLEKVLKCWLFPCDMEMYFSMYFGACLHVCLQR